MKPENSGTTSILKGVSTLDELCKNARIVLLFLVIIAFGGSVDAGHSTLDLVDPGFNPQIQTNFFGTKQVMAIVSLPDGKFLVGGNFSSYNRIPTGRLVRLNADATLDATFNNTLLVSGFVGRVLLQADGKIIVRGSNLLLTGQTTPGKQLIRFNPDGSHDTTFNYTEGGSVAGIAIDASGRILLSGSFPVSGLPDRKGIRLNADGSVDTSFQYGSGILSENIAAQNNKMIIAGLLNSQPTMQRLNEDGSIDTAFTPRNLNVHNAIPLVQPDGKILVLELSKLYRFNENGTDDTGFTSTDFPPNTTRIMALASDGKITVSYGSNPTQITRFLSNGVVDGSFTPYGATFYSTFGLQPDGGVLIGDQLNGGNSPLENHFVRLFPNGSPDPAFNPGGIGFQNINPARIRAITVLADGKIMIGGDFDLVNDVLRFKMARINADATLDKTFQIPLGGSGNTFTQILEILNITPQPDGKLLVSGDFDYKVNGVSKSNLVRLNADGTIDPNFVLNVFIGSGFFLSGGVKLKSVVLSDGKILVGASRSTFTGSIAVPVKLNSDGTRDTSFAPTIFASADAVFIRDIAVQPDGKIIIVGDHTTFTTSFIDKSFVARLNPDGTTDATFQISEELDKVVFALALQPNGKMLIVKGDYPGTPNQQSNVLRLNADGSPDSTFNAPTIANGRVNAILLLPTGKIFAGGKFTVMAGGQPTTNLMRLDADGNIESTTYNLNDEVLCLAIDGEGRVLVGGRFTVIGANGAGESRSYVARLTDAVLFDFDGDGRADISVFRPSENRWYILRSSDGQVTQHVFAISGDLAVPAYYDGDGRTEVAVFRPSSGDWWYLSSTVSAQFSTHWGQAGDIPRPSDFDGDGKTDFVVYRPSTSVWYRLSATGQTSVINFGIAEDKPLVGDFDGDGKSDAAIYRPSTGDWWYAASSAGEQPRVTHWGVSTDIPVPADYDGDGKTDLAVYRPSQGAWYISNSGGASPTIIGFGLAEDKPVPADYDGDGRADIAVFRPSSGFWYLMRSTAGFTALPFGISTDIPTPNAFVP